jgi:hypothetical protein
MQVRNSRHGWQSMSPARHRADLCSWSCVFVSRVDGQSFRSYLQDVSQLSPHVRFVCNSFSRWSFAHAMVPCSLLACWLRCFPRSRRTSSRRRTASQTPGYDFLLLLLRLIKPRVVVLLACSDWLGSHAVSRSDCWPVQLGTRCGRRRCDCCTQSDSDCDG